MINKPKSDQKGFVIVELIIMIIVIAILATIYVSYSNKSLQSKNENKQTVNQQAISTSLQSDLISASTQFKIFQVENSQYPDTISIDCTTDPDTTTNKCLKVSKGNEFINFKSNNLSDPQTFTLSAKNNNIEFIVTDTLSPKLINN